VNTQDIYFQAAQPGRKDRREPSATLGPADLPAERRIDPLDRPPPLQAAPETRRDSLGAFLVPGGAWVADSPKTSQRLLKGLLSHFAYDESPAVRTRICCVSGRPDSPKGPRRVCWSRGKYRAPWGALIRVLASPSLSPGNKGSRRVVQIMTYDIISAAPETSVSDIATLLVHHRIKRVPIVRDGKLVGLVSRANIIEALAGVRRKERDVPLENHARV
jgi:CBS domain-containing protein